MRSHVRQDDIDALVRQLLELRSATDPGYTHPESAELSKKDKHSRARKALILAGVLVQSLADWAIKHHVGLALAGKDNNEDWPSLDDHAYEQGDHEASDPVAKRRAIAALLGPLKLPYGNELSQALSALNLGEVRSIVAPVNAGLHGQGATLWESRLRAIAHVDFRYAADGRKGKAQEIVGLAYGCSKETLESWQKRLPEYLTPAHVKRVRGRAQAHGKWKVDLERQRFSGEDDSDAREFLDSEYGPGQLAKDAAAHQAAQPKGSPNITKLKKR
jgi:hypothetical protein